MAKYLTVKTLFRACALALIQLIAVVLIKDIVQAQLLETIESRAESILHTGKLIDYTLQPSAAALRLLDMPGIAGVEIFESNGRRVAQAGEPLEIAGYSLDRVEILRHRSKTNERFEIFWPESILDNRFGLAVRIDIRKDHQAANHTRSWMIALTIMVVVAYVAVMKVPLRCASIKILNQPKAKF